MNPIYFWIVCALLLCGACDDSEKKADDASTDDSSSETDTNSDSDTGVDTDTDTNPDITDAMLERSLLSVGNNYRMKALLAKAAAGEEVTLAYIGGSITQGYTATADESYVFGSAELFKQRFAPGDGSNVHVVNAGMGGTPSTLGMLRYQRDVLDQSPTPPDLVVVEFAVNDGDDPTNGEAYESLVRKILQSENHPAVILLFSVFRSHWNLEDRLAPVGEHYNLPMISIKEAVVPELDAGTFTHDEFFRDEYHPNEWGFRVMSEIIDYYFATVAEAAADNADITIPDTAAIGIQFTDIQPVVPSTPTAAGTLEIDPGSFIDVDAVLPSIEWKNEKYFTENWQKKTDDTNTPFTLTTTCKNLVVSYKKSSLNSFGTAEFYVDGTLVESVPGYTSDGWNNPWTMVLLDEDVSAEHTLQVQMAEGSETDNFTLLIFGYTP